MNEVQHGVLPTGWTTVPLEEAATVVQGQSPPSAECNKNEVGIPFFQGKAEFGEIHPVPAQWCPTPKKRAGAGDILLSVRAPVGPTNVAYQACGIGRGLAAIRPLANVHPRYLLHYLRSSSELLRREATGSTFEAISGAQLRKHPVVLAPLGVQVAISDALDSHLSRLDATAATLEQVLRNLKRYRASVLKAAVEGRLVPTEAEAARAEGRAYEPASELLTRILAERRARWAALGKKGTYKEPVPPDTTGLPALPEGWCWGTVEQTASDVNYGTSSKTGNEVDGGVPVLRMGNIVDGRLDWALLKFLPTAHSEFPALLLESGDVLFNRTNSPELVGKSAVYRGSTHPTSFASYLIRLRLLNGIVPEYVCAFVNSVHGREWVATVVSQQVGQANVNGSKLKALAFPIPPAREQLRIAAEMDRLLTIADAAERSVKANLARIKGLRSGVLRAAFRGELV